MNRTFPIYKPGRPTERLLLILATIIAGGGIYILKNAPIPLSKNDPLISGGIVIFSFWILHLFLNIKKIQGDELMLPMAAFLTFMGWLEIYRLEPALAVKQTYWLLIAHGAFIAWLIFVRDYRILEDYKYIFLVGAIILQITVALFGQEVNGARLWFNLKIFSIQPVEFVKIFLTVFLAAYLKQNREILGKPLWGPQEKYLLKYYLLLFVLWGTAEALLILQKDLGMALLLFGVFMGLFYVVTRKGSLIATGFSLFALVSLLLYRLFPHVRVRIDNWWTPWTDAEGGGYQLIQSLFSLANGGILGTGLGRGEPFLIPAVHTDFIFAALSEELGLIGALIILGVFLVLIQRMFSTALNSTDEFGIFLALGLSLMFATQVFIIVGGCVKFIPLTGITLPFVSYGGSSLVSNFILLGLFLEISERSAAEGQISVAEANSDE